MLFVCNLLSRYNLHTSKLREAEKDKVKTQDTRIEQRILGGMSINKGVRKLAANVSALALPTSFATAVKDFDVFLSSYENRPGMSNCAVCCVGNTVSRTLLAEVCDRDS